MCALISPSVLYLGHVVNKDGLHPNPITVDNVLRCKTPQNVKETQQILKKEHTFFCYLFIDHCSFKTINVMAFQTFSVQHQTGWTAEYCNMPLLTSTVYLPGLLATHEYYNNPLLAFSVYLRGLRATYEYYNKPLLTSSVYLSGMPATHGYLFSLHAISAPNAILKIGNYTIDI